MDDVIENCQTTFEEDGVNQQTLDDLRKVGFPLSSAITKLSSRLSFSSLTAAYLLLASFILQPTSFSVDFEFLLCWNCRAQYFRFWGRESGGK